MTDFVVQHWTFPYFHGSSWLQIPSTWRSKWTTTHKCSHQPMELKQSVTHANANAKLLSSSPTLPDSWRPQRHCPQRGHQSGCRNLRLKRAIEETAKFERLKSLPIHVWISFIVSQVQKMSSSMCHNPPAYGHTKDLRALSLWCHCHSQNHKCQQTSEEPAQFCKGWKWNFYLGTCCRESKAEYPGAKVRSVQELSLQVVLKSNRLHCWSPYRTWEINSKHGRSENRANELNESAPLRSLHFRYCSCCHAESCQKLTKNSPKK